MASIFLRDVPDELVYRLRRAALDERKKFQEWCVEKLARAVQPVEPEPMLDPGEYTRPLKLRRKRAAKPSG